MCESIGYSLAETVAFGDGDNDIEMLRYVGLGVAMKNARPFVQDSADLVLEVNYVVIHSFGLFLKQNFTPFDCVPVDE